MGMWFRFECPACEYSARASGGRDSGMIAAVETSICTSCSNLVDVVVAWLRDEGSSGEDTGSCPLCKSEEVTPWDPDSRVCPKCGAKMSEGVADAIWD
jgi:hypothetical protein